MSAGQKKPRDTSERVARRLVTEGRISRELAEQALRQHEATGQRFEEALIECGLSEKSLLRALAETYRVQYITTQNLAAATVSKTILQLVPRRIAQQRQIAPVMLDRKQSVLSIVTADPEDIETVKELQIATQVRTIRPLLARPSAVSAAIAKFYDDDAFAFQALDDVRFGSANGIERNPIAQLMGPTLFDNLEQIGSPPPPASVPQKSAPAASRAPQPIPPLPSAPAAVPARHPPTPSAFAPIPHAYSEPPQELNLDEVEELSLSSPPPPAANQEAALSLRLPPDVTEPTNARLIGERRSFSPPASFRPSLESLESRRHEGSREPESIGEPLQLALVLVSLLEGSRRDLRGHSLHTARLVRNVCERLDLPEPRIRAAETGALVHDVGKASGGFHLTPFNVAQFDGHRTGAEKLYATPNRVLETARLSPRTTQCVTHMYERYDGNGFPGKLRGNDIPLESRILAICDSYSDLTSNPRNSYRKVLGAQQACEALRDLAGTVFDPRVLDRFTRAVLGDDLAQQLRRDRGVVLLVDPDIEETTVLEFALLEGQYDVHVTRTEEEALGFVEHGKGIDLIVSEVTLASGSGFSLLDRMKESTRGQTVTFVFLSNETDSSTVAAALHRGAADYLLKPLASRVAVAKIRHLLEQRHRQQAVRGVSGSLEEMSLPDIVQVLHQGRKTGALKLNGAGQSGIVYFKEGSIIHAVAGALRGEDAFYTLVGIDKGGFTVDPEVTPSEQTISTSPEMLLLEGLRRLDEAKR